MVRHSLPSQAVRSGKTAKERLIQMMLDKKATGNQREP